MVPQKGIFYCVQMSFYFTTGIGSIQRNSGELEKLFTGNIYSTRPDYHYKYSILPLGSRVAFTFNSDHVNPQ